MSHRASSRLARPTLLVGLFAALALSVCVGCGGGDQDGTATVSIASIEPAQTYPGVEATVDFSIEAGDGVSASELEWEVDFGDGNEQNGSGTSGTANHAWEQSGQYTVEVTALAGGNAVGSASERVRVLSPIDLTVDNIQARPANVEVEENFSVAVDVENLSPTPVETSFNVAVYLTDQTTVAEEDIGDLTKVGETTVEAGEMPAIGPGATKSLNIASTAPSDVETGEYRMVPWINPEGQFADENPDDNFKVSQRVVRIENITSELPDVVVKDVYAIPDRAFPVLNQFQRGFTLENQGGKEAFDVKTRTYLSVGDQEVDENDIEINTSEESVSIPSAGTKEIGPDQFVLEEDIEPPNDGEKTVYVIVEAFLEGDGQEADDQNNQGISDPPITVTDQRSDGPDIAVDSFSVSPQKTFLDGSLEVSMDLSNQGKSDVGTFFCGLYLGQEARVNLSSDARFASISVPSLQSQKSTMIEQSVTVPGIHDPGTYYIYTVCDPNASIGGETFRSNNQKVHPDPVEITDKANVDLYVDTLVVPKTAQETSTVGLTATICVTGQNASGSTKGELYQTTGTQVDFDQDPLQTFDIPNINPGECKDVSLEFEADCEDFEEKYAYGVAVDVDETLPEKDEENNTQTGSNPLEIEGPFCKCTEDMYEPNDKPREAIGISSGTTSAAVCAPGSCDFFRVGLQSGDSLRVETTFESDKGALETKLFDPSGVSVLDSDATEDRQRVATYGVPNKGQYVFSVCGAESSSRNLYDVDVDVLPQVSGIDLIPDSIDLPSRATFSIGAKVQADFRIHNIGQTKSGSFDSSLVITPDRAVGDGNDVPLKPATVSSNAIPGGSSTDISQSFELPTSISDGEYYLAVRVDPSDTQMEADTTNNTAFSRKIDIETRCFDALEPNDSFSEAEPVDDGSFNNLVACASEDDYYKICPSDAQKFTVTADFNDQMGDIDLELYDRHLNIIDSSAQTGANKEEVSVSYVNGAQCYYARALVLTTQQQLETTYNMTVDIQDVDPSLKCDSTFEPNNSFSTASSFIAAEQQTNPTGTLDRCPASDSDFYRLDLNRGQKVTLRGLLEPKSQPGTLRLQLYTPNQKPTKNVETAPGVPTAEIKDYVAPSTGTYFLQVTLTGSTRRVTYRLESAGLDGIDLAVGNLSFWSGTYKSGDPLLFDFDLSNLRSGTAKTPTYSVYLGDSQTHDPMNDVQLTQVTRSSDLSGNSTVQISERAQLPQSVASGTHYIHLVVEPVMSQNDPNGANDVATRPIDFQ